MPSVNFKIVWPDGDVGVYYSPSTVIRDHLQSGSYPQDGFRRLCTTALNAASERVRQRFGYACTAANAELEKISDKLDELQARHIHGPVQLAAMDTEGRNLGAGKPAHYSAMVIGAGQAGLAMSYQLKTAGIDHLVLEASGEIAHAWRHERWDSFCLVTPNWQCQLPGFPYQGDDPDGFMVKEDIIEYLESYYAFFKPPVVFHSPVTELKREQGVYHIRSGERRYTCDQVIICCGGYHEPRIPPAADALPPTIKQIHSRDYRNQDQLPEGEVLVVGSAQSGSQIAEDLHLAGRQVHLCVGKAPRVHRRYRGKDVVKWLDDMNYYATTIEEHPDGANAPHATNHYVTGRDGGRDINLRIFAEQGMKLYGRLKQASRDSLSFHDDLAANLDHADEVAARIAASIETYIQQQGIDAPADDNLNSDYLPPEVTQLDLKDVNITSVVWATGFHLNYDWIQLPVLNDEGFPLQKRGISPEPGLYFLGLNWMHTWGSGRFYHVGQDAEFLARAIRKRHRSVGGAACV
ncbi:MSMEG_0569 family flavin-dependent oxidoreductase [Marinobacter sp. M-5]|uniref:MSMEG_0569 family flavin-dependent oxidoreductase n=1 Tax=Marinobacter sp. M-5 TaxID=3081089 RepID=UPI00293CA38E|nr:MSMEG_0569 family flavin-dependent oxidoreductase [Marinobacter sp. M-5]MDV3503458.1 MSMEG_0569 family flavin-dependent oxidoreductase [Marinobacter sp. M-5]